MLLSSRAHPDTEMSNVDKIISPWSFIVDSFVFWESESYATLDKLIQEQNLKEEHFQSLWAVLGEYNLHNAEPALLLLKRGSAPKSPIIAKHLSFSLMRVDTKKCIVCIDQSITAEDLLQFLIRINYIENGSPYTYTNIPIPSSKSGVVGGVTFKNVNIRSFYTLSDVANYVKKFIHHPRANERDFLRLLHGCSAIYMVLHQMDGEGPYFYFIDILEPENCSATLRTDMDSCFGFDHLYTLFVDVISDLGIIPPLKIVNETKFDGIQEFRGTLPAVIAGFSREDWLWLREYFESRLKTDDPHSLLPLINAAIDHLSDGAQLSKDVLRRAAHTYFYMT